MKTYKIYTLITQSIFSKLVRKIKFVKQKKKNPFLGT